MHPSQTLVTSCTEVIWDCCLNAQWLYRWHVIPILSVPTLTLLTLFHCIVNILLQHCVQTHYSPHILPGREKTHATMNHWQGLLIAGTSSIYWKNNYITQPTIFTVSIDLHEVREWTKINLGLSMRCNSSMHKAKGSPWIIWVFVEEKEKLSSQWSGKWKCWLAWQKEKSPQNGSS